MSKRFVIEVDSHSVLTESEMYPDGPFPGVLESLDGWTPERMLWEWELLPDLGMTVRDKDTGELYKHIGNGHWRKL